MAAEGRPLKTKLTDLHEILFEQLERLSNPELKGAKLDEEIKRGHAISSISAQIIQNGNLAVTSQKGLCRLNVLAGDVFPQVQSVLIVWRKKSGLAAVLARRDLAAQLAVVEDLNPHAVQFQRAPQLAGHGGFPSGRQTDHGNNQFCFHNILPCRGSKVESGSAFVFLC